MTDHLERDLTAELQTRPTTSEPTPLPLEEIRAAGDDALRRRHVRQGLLASLAAAAAVAAIAAPVALRASGHHDAPAPVTSPSPTATTAASTAERVIARGDAYGLAVGPDGQIATLWTTCLRGHPAAGCKVAWQLRSGERTWSGMAHDGDNLTAVDGGFAITSFATERGLILDYDGTTVPLHKASELDSTAGATPDMHYRDARLIDPADRTWAVLSDDAGHHFWEAIADDGTVWAERVAGSTTELAWRDADGSWHRRRLLGAGEVTPGPITASGDHVAAASATVVVDSNPLAGLAVSSDHGATWEDLPAASLPFGEITDLVATADGTLYVQTLTRGLFRSAGTDWTTYTPVQAPAGLSDLQAMPDGSLAAIEYEHDHTTLVGLRADGERLVVSGTLLPAEGAEPSASAATPSSLADLPRWTGPTVPYLREGSLVVNGASIPAPGARSLVAAGDVVIVEGRRDPATGAVSFSVLRGGRLVPALWFGTAAPPRLSANGQYAAMTSYPDAATTRVTLLDPMTGTAYGHLDLDAPYVTCCGGGQRVELVGVDNLGDVYFSNAQPSGTDVWRWAPSQSPTDLGKVADAQGVTPLGLLMTHGQGWPGTLDLVRADRAGRSISTDLEGGIWSPDGRRVALADGISFTDVETGQRFALSRLPDQRNTHFPSRP